MLCKWSSNHTHSKSVCYNIIIIQISFCKAGPLLPKCAMYHKQLDIIVYANSDNTLGRTNKSLTYFIVSWYIIKIEGNRLWCHIVSAVYSVVCYCHRRISNCIRSYYSCMWCHEVINRNHQHTTQARSQFSDNGGLFSSDFGPFSGFENWSSQWLFRKNLDF